MALLEVTGVGRVFGGLRSHVAVESVSFTLSAGEVLGVVGESGSGKSTLARMVCGLDQPTSGSILMDGENVANMPRAQLWSRVQLVPQDSYGSLNAALAVRDIVAEPLHYFRGRPWRDANREAVGRLEEVGLDPAIARRKAGELSGGQRQRVALARALAVDPDVVICDESTSALDVSVQAQILTVLQDLNSRSGFSMLFVSHDISVVGYVSDRVLVLKDGRLVEELPAERLDPQHASEEYTRRLLAAVPTLARDRRAG